jgi:hypothetical protein
MIVELIQRVPPLLEAAVSYCIGTPSRELLLLLLLLLLKMAVSLGGHENSRSSRNWVTDAQTQVIKFTNGRQMRRTY